MPRLHRTVSPTQPSFKTLMHQTSCRHGDLPGIQVSSSRCVFLRLWVSLVRICLIPAADGVSINTKILLDPLAADDWCSHLPRISVTFPPKEAVISTATLLILRSPIFTLFNPFFPTHLLLSPPSCPFLFQWLHLNKSVFLSFNFLLHRNCFS